MANLPFCSRIFRQPHFQPFNLDAGRLDHHEFGLDIFDGKVAKLLGALAEELAKKEADDGQARRQGSLQYPSSQTYRIHARARCVARSPDMRPTPAFAVVRNMCLEVRRSPCIGVLPRRAMSPLAITSRTAGLRFVSHISLEGGESYRAHQTETVAVRLEC